MIAGCRVVTVQKTVEVPQFLFSLAMRTRWLTCPLLCTLGVLVQTVQFLDKVVAVPVVVARCSYSARSLTRPLCATTGVMVQTVQFLDKVVALCPLFSRLVHTVPDVQKTFGGAADAVLRCLGRPCDHAALMAVFMAMGRLMGFSRIFRIFRASPGCPGVERQCQLVFDFQPVSCACG